MTGRSARARPDQLAALAPGPPSTVAATVVPRPRATVAAVVECRTARARYALLVDPVGSVPFTGTKPRRCLVTPPLDGWPPARFAVELELCPLRGTSEPTLLSYVAAGSPPFAVREEAAGGVTVDVGGATVSTGVHLDYAQWQRVAVDWDGATGTLRVHKDDGPRRVVDEGSGRPPAPMGPPRFETRVAAAGPVAPGGTLVVGQRQGRPGVAADFRATAELRGAVAEVRLWRSPPDFSSPAAREPDDADPGLFARWRFSALGVELGEAVGSPGSPVALLGGFRPGDVRDVRRFRVVAWDGRCAVATGPVLEAGREHHVELALGGDGPVVTVDGAPCAGAPVDPADLEAGGRRGFTVGPVDELAELTVTGPGGRLLASYRGDDGARLEDRSGNGLDLDLTP